jgi:RHS repeat-associated protein
MKHRGWMQLACIVWPALAYGAEPEVVHFYHVDPIGSIRAVTDVGGGVVSRRDYLPFGEEIPCEAGGREKIPGYCDDPRTGLRFAGKPRDAESALDDFGARYFSGAQGRFVTPDVIGPDPGTPQTLNRYRYGLNNPLRYVDRTGRYEEDVHRALTRVLALAAGFSDAHATRIAAADQGVDDNPQTNPLQAGWRDPFSGLPALQQYHFTTIGRRDQMWLDFVNIATARAAEDALDALGVFLHTQQDSFSHAGFGPTFGHVPKGIADAALQAMSDDASPLVGDPRIPEALHAVDKTYMRPQIADQMARNTFSYLVAAAAQLGHATNYRRYPLLEPHVQAFNRARSMKEKQNILNRIEEMLGDRP